MRAALLGALMMAIFTTASAEHPVQMTLSTLQCIGCHDDEDPLQNHSGSHPVGVIYPENQADYTPREVLRMFLSLPEDRVACVTCHSELPTGHQAYNLLTDTKVRYRAPPLKVTRCIDCHYRQ